MNFSNFFIRRPIFAGVVSGIILLLGLLALGRLPISEYPEVVPPTIVVRATYPGANPKTIAETVASPLEQSINGVEDSLYMFSQATPDGVMTLTITFKLGTDVDKAQVQVQNRVSQVLAKLPEEVRQLGVTTTKQSPDLTMVVHLFSPNGRYDEVYLRNYATLQVKDVLARIPGAGDVQLFGSGDYAMRVWLDPDKIAARNLTASDVVSALREQNVQIAAGTIGEPPVSHPVSFELKVNAKGRLLSAEEFEQIIVKTGARGEKILLKDIARIEMGASGYSLRSLLDNKTAVAVPIFQSPGANALQLSKDVRRTMEELKKNFPEGIDYSVVYDPTVFVSHSIEAVVHTLIEAIVLVVIVVVLFLQTWRASLIPLAAVPVSLVGTFAVMLALGFSINNLSLFGLVLAIGIVVDDAIVVVENVERNIALGLSPGDAARRAMSEVTGPIVATALVLCAVFIPTGFISGLTGQFYKQFAITIAISTVISAINSLTLSPALCAVLLQDHKAPKDLFGRIMERLLGWFFRPFNRLFAWSGERYAAGVATVIRKGAIALAVYGGLVLLTGWSFNKVPTGFVPTQDKQYLVAFAQLPDGASLERTDAVIRRMTDIGLKQPGVQSSVAFPGLSINGFTVAPNAGIAFFCLKPFEERTSRELSGPAITAALNQKFSVIQDAFILAVPPPPVNGLGTIGGFKLFVEDRADLGYDALYQALQTMIGKGYQTPGLGGVFSTFTVNVPQLDAEIDRDKAKQQGVPLQNLFETMQIYLGSLYVNDFNRFGRTYEVIAQADAQFRQHPEDITRLKTRNSQGQMVPLGTLVKVKETYGPDRAMRYNGYPAAEINGAPAPGFSSGQAEALMAKIGADNLPKGMAYEWTDLTYQRILAGNTAVFIYPLCVLLVFLVLAAQYESFRLPLAIILILPMCLLFAITGVWLKGSDNNIFTQIGFIVLIGLACKNAILIVEFAKHNQDHGKSPIEAAIEACRLRLRPILMTSIAFIAGVFPLVRSSGAGAEMRQAMGVAVFSGMIGVTLFGLFLTPVFYVTLMKLGWKHRPAPVSHTSALGATGAATAAVAVIALLLATSPAGAGPLTIGPDYHSPTNSSPATYKAAELGNWKEGEPLDRVPKGNWWGAFNDPGLEELEAQALQANQTLKGAVARVEQSRATARVARGELLPSLNLAPSFARQRYSPNQSPSFGNVTANTFSVPLDLSYEIDLWGRVRRSFESARADAQASLADYYNVLLALQTDVAQNYFTLRALDAEIATVAGTVALRHEQVNLVRSRFEGGIGNELDVARAETELATTEADAASLARRRTELENALAILAGSNPSTFRLPAGTTTSWNPQPPEIPAGLPAELLERRPDVAEAERQLAASNARIGVAKAAFFPVVTLTASGGYLSGELDSLFKWDSRVWSIGPSVSLPIFAGGRNRANYRRSQAAFDEAVARYRQQVLLAFGDVEDSLSAIRHLADQSAAQERAVAQARRAADLATDRFRSGIVSYLEVVDADREALSAERTNNQLAGQRLTAAVQLIKALGGGWTEAQLFAKTTAR
ncbi:MAG TPA: multidrug efflux RND transporter permease subunit [Candidatus Acidoferrum sp.]|jgi:hydrophobe/amphiphile efflux-1 (HAE1) family protein/NodT family efflux transporter outer membrane factor (OMF) lipoprotein|nr:multidrug efflux RND transporter permease subunit [Candidatus Acidoferrum sp.]